MDELFEKSLLYDFYGELLTEHQQAVYQSFVFEDMSLAEVADEQGITRQGVHDLVKRCDKLLQGYEDKLHLVKKFVAIKKNASEIEKLICGELSATSGTDSLRADAGKAGAGEDKVPGYEERLSRIRQLTQNILEEL